MIKKALAIAFNSLKVTFRDKGNLIWLIIMPIVWTTLIGTMSTPGKEDEKIPVGFLNSDRGIYGEVFAEILRKEESIKIVAVAEDDEDKMRNLVKDTKFSVGLIVPDNFSEKLKAGELVVIEILKSERNSSYFLEEFIEKTAERISIDALAANFTVEKIGERRMVLEEEVLENEKERIWEEAFVKADAFFEPAPAVGVKYVVLSVEKRDENIPIGMEASSPGFAVMFVMMGVCFAGVAMVQERHHKTLARLLTTPTEKFFIISGKMLGFFLLGFIQFLILILFGQLVLKVNWGNLPLGVLLLVISYVLSVTGLGTLLSVVVRTSAQAGAFAVLISMVTSMLGGAWWPIEIVPKFMQNIARFTPQYWAINGFNKIITRGFGITEILPNFYVLLAISAISLLLAIRFFRFE
ncbi:ABC transporter permease [bacterium]|nr:ABC transporter permease [bacterium]MBU4601731.1 ABC transporter permease [bacterium]MCG2762111.1 ABC transporter permease [Candidatus Atribacteria bacterium]